MPQGYSVELFENDGFTGRSKILHGGNWTSVDQQMQCQNLIGTDFDNVTSSLAVFRTELG